MQIGAVDSIGDKFVGGALGFVLWQVGGALSFVLDQVGGDFSFVRKQAGGVLSFAAVLRGGLWPPTPPLCRCAEYTTGLHLHPWRMHLPQRNIADEFL